MRKFLNHIIQVLIQVSGGLKGRAQDLSPPSNWPFCEMYHVILMFVFSA